MNKTRPEILLELDSQNNTPDLFVNKSMSTAAGSSACATQSAKKKSYSANIILYYFDPAIRLRTASTFFVKEHVPTQSCSTRKLLSNDTMDMIWSYFNGNWLLHKAALLCTSERTRLRKASEDRQIVIHCRLFFVEPSNPLSSFKEILSNKEQLYSVI